MSNIHKVVVEVNIDIRSFLFLLSDRCRCLGIAVDKIVMFIDLFLDFCLVFHTLLLELLLEAVRIYVHFSIRIRFPIRIHHLFLCRSLYDLWSLSRIIEGLLLFSQALHSFLVLTVDCIREAHLEFVTVIVQVAVLDSVLLFIELYTLRNV